MSRLESLANNLLKPINPAFTVILGLYTIGWGLWIFAPWWVVFPHAAIYTVMSALASEIAWGAVAVGVGVIIVRGALKPVSWNIEIGSLVAFFFWLGISILYFIGDWHNTGGITSLTFALYSGLIWLNVKVNRTHYDRSLE